MIIEKVDHNKQLEFLVKAYSEWGWAIFPLNKIKRNYNHVHTWCACRDGLECATPGKHPLIRWTHRDQYPDLKTIKEMLADGFTGWGVHLGWSGMLCADLDPRNGGEAKKFVREWRYDRGVPFLATHTGSGGIHFYFPDCSECDPIRGFHMYGESFTTKIPFADGDDLFAGQHYTVLPYSPHKSGKLYIPFYPPREVFYERILDHVPVTRKSLDVR